MSMLKHILLFEGFVSETKLSDAEIKLDVDIIEELLTQEGFQVKSMSLVKPVISAVVKDGDNTAYLTGGDMKSIILDVLDVDDVKLSVEAMPGGFVKYNIEIL